MEPARIPTDRLVRRIGSRLWPTWHIDVTMADMQQVNVEPLSLERLRGLLPDDQAAAVDQYAANAKAMLAGHTVWNINATAQGGGVAEMLQSLLAYVRGVGVDTQWLVLDGDAEFFAITKRIHNLLHGGVGDGGPLAAAEDSHYREVLQGNLEAFKAKIRPGDIVLLHDPQTAGLVEGLKDTGAALVWRCHVGTDEPNPQTDLAWGFLRPHLEACDAFIFTRTTYAPTWVEPEKLWIIPPSIDPFSAKNEDMDPDTVLKILIGLGLIGSEQTSAPIAFRNRDGSSATMSERPRIIPADVAPAIDDRLVVQVSRWDQLKDMTGVLKGFADRIGDLPDDVHLMLVGPDVSGVSDDPEGAEVLADCRALWSLYPEAVRNRIHLVCLPMDSVSENALMVNALQRHAHIMVQKSLVEGFGLTVTEAMWKARPVIASAVGGIRDQIEDGRDGLLLADATDLDGFADLLVKILADDELAARIGDAGRERVLRDFIGARHLMQYVDLFAVLAPGTA